MMLNDEPSEEAKAKLAPTDSRLRPDMRRMENGDLGTLLFSEFLKRARIWSCLKHNVNIFADGAAAEKHRLEEKQRSARKERKKNNGDWSPRSV